MAQGVSQESPHERPHSGRRKDVKAKHIRKEGLIGTGNPKKNQREPDT